MDMREKIQAWIKEHEEEMLIDIRRLVRYPSISVRNEESEAEPYGAACRAVLEEFLSMGQEYGFDARNVDNHCGLLTWKNGDATIGLWGHLDVVPNNGEWVYPPFAVTQKGDHLIGRGVSDNKGPTVVSLYAMRCIRDLLLPFKMSLQLFGGCAEETGMDDVAHYLAHNTPPEYNIIGDTEFPVCHAEKGIADISFESPALSSAVRNLRAGTVTNIVPDYAEITLAMTDALEDKLGDLPGDISIVGDNRSVTLSARGLAKHSAMPQGSLNAIHKLLAAVKDTGLLSEADQKALDFIIDACGVSDGSSLGIAGSDDISGALTCVGSILRLVEGKARLNVNIRYPVTFSAEDIIKSIEAACAPQGYVVTHTHDSAPNFVEKDSFFVQALMSAYNKVTGANAEPYVMGGGTYARKLPNAVAFGVSLPYDFSELELPPGHGSVHCPDESYSFANLLKGLEIYILSLLELDKQISAS